jgi:DNA-binding transcriptional ArsR family regulator
MVVYSESMEMAHPLPEEVVLLIARRFAVLAEPTRLRILDFLRARGDASVQELADTLGATHANVSKHLGVLHGERIVGRRKQGTRTLYRVQDPVVFRLCEEVCGGLAEQARELGAIFQSAA